MRPDFCDQIARSLIIVARTTPSFIPLSSFIAAIDHETARFFFELFLIALISTR